MPELAPWQLELLAGSRIGHLATVDDNGRPHVVPVCFVYLPGAVYTPIDEKPKRAAATQLRRIRNIHARPDATLVVDRYSEDWTELAWLQLRGMAGLSEDPAERSTALVALCTKYKQYRSMDLESRPLIRLTVSSAIGWRAAN